LRMVLPYLFTPGWMRSLLGRVERRTHLRR
jgi:hypothetical protein